MSASIEKYRLEERIRISYLKYAGNIETVSKECGVDYEYTLKICNKYKRKMIKDPNMWVGTSIAGYVMVGSEERKIHLRATLQEEINKQPIEVSLCCNKPIKKIVWDNEHRAVCEKCEKDCLYTVEDIRDKRLILKLIEQLREEDVTTVDLVVKLGILGNQNGPQILHKETNYNLMFGGSRLDAEGKELVKKAEDLDARSREHVRNELSKDLKKLAMDAKFEDKNEK